MKTKKRLEDYSWDELLEATSGKEAMKENGREIGKYTLDEKIGIHTENEELRTLWASMGGDASIDKLLQWQIDNGFRVCDLDRTEEWCNNISIALTGRKLSKKHINNVRAGVNRWIDTLSEKERKELFTNKSMLGKKHKPETINKMKKKAKGRVISEEQKKKISNTLCVAIIATNLKSGKKKEYKSTKEAKEKLGLTGILHVLKGRSKQCGGYFFEYA